MNKSKPYLLWIITVVITVSAMFYQRMTGPTYPKKVNVELGGKEYEFKLLRSNEIGTPCDINLEVENSEVKATIYFKRFKVEEAWQEVKMQRKISHKKAFIGEGDKINILTATLPEQPSAGKIEYHIDLYKNEQKVSIAADEPIVVRFKGFVPRSILIPHVLFMIIALFLGTRAGIEAIFAGDKTFKFTRITLITFGIGGLILGPIVQKYAFGELWTGWPFGGDWTDNKTIFAWIFWLIAFFVLRKKPKNRIWPIIAMLVLFAMYMIPHSMGGSELDNKTGEIETGVRA
ncbi:MAG: hypothetical protein GQ552_02725 [Flavobacteriaceae bacterium]|nr:hypothetical protein [Flavobacteriaceae bacterium]